MLGVAKILELVSVLAACRIAPISPLKIPVTKPLAEPRTSPKTEKSPSTSG